MAKKKQATVTTDKVHMRVPSDWKSAWMAKASLDGLSLTDWMAERCNEGLPAKVQADLSIKPGIGRPKKTEEK